MKITISSHLLTHEDTAVNAGFIDYNCSQGQVSNRQSIALTVYEDNELIGALDGYIFFDWLTVSRLWIDPKQRKNKIGTKLLLEAHAQAKILGCVGSTLSTYDFQAREFYEKHGYTVFGILSDNPKGHERYFMQKEL